MGPVRLTFRVADNEQWEMIYPDLSFVPQIGQSLCLVHDSRSNAWYRVRDVQSFYYMDRSTVHLSSDGVVVVDVVVILEEE
jgi:hypothetical protein